MNNELGKRIHLRRKELGLSLEKLADKTKLNKSTIQRYETGSIEHVKFSDIVVLADVLCVTTDWLFIGEISDESNENNLETIMFQKTRECFTSFLNAETEANKQDSFKQYMLLYSILCSAGLAIKYNKWLVSKEEENESNEH